MEIGVDGRTEEPVEGERKSSGRSGTRRRKETGGTTFRASPSQASQAGAVRPNSPRLCNVFLPVRAMHERPSVNRGSPAGRPLGRRDRRRSVGERSETRPARVHRSAVRQKRSPGIPVCPQPRNNNSEAAYAVRRAAGAMDEPVSSFKASVVDGRECDHVDDGRWRGRKKAGDDSLLSLVSLAEAGAREASRAVGAKQSLFMGPRRRQSRDAREPRERGPERRERGVEEPPFVQKDKGRRGEEKTRVQETEQIRGATDLLTSFGRRKKLGPGRGRARETPLN